MAVSFTERAAAQVQVYLAERGGGLGIRVIVQSSECSGLAYRLVFVDEEENEDTVFVSHASRIYIDPKSLVWLDGTIIDFIETDNESGFAFQNPNVSSQCGCGESFYV